jgi:hypothetical protein
MKKLYQQIKYRFILSENERTAIKIGFVVLEEYSTKRFFRRTNVGKVVSKIINK